MSKSIYCKLLVSFSDVIMLGMIGGKLLDITGCLLEDFWNKGKVCFELWFLLIIYLYYHIYISKLALDIGVATISCCVCMLSYYH